MNKYFAEAEMKKDARALPQTARSKSNYGEKKQILKYLRVETPPVLHTPLPPDLMVDRDCAKKILKRNLEYH